MEDPGSIPGLGRSPGEGNGNPLQYSCLENPMDRGAWQATVHGFAKSQTRLNDFTFTFFCIIVGLSLMCFFSNAYYFNLCPLFYKPLMMLLLEYTHDFWNIFLTLIFIFYQRGKHHSLPPSLVTDSAESKSYHRVSGSRFLCSPKALCRADHKFSVKFT